MCVASKPSKPYIPPAPKPIPPAPAPIEEQTQEEPVIGGRKDENKASKKKRKGTRGLRNDLNVPGGLNGLNIPGG